MHLFGYSTAYSPDRKLLASRSLVDNNVRVWDTRAGQLCGKPITMSNVDAIALSPALNDRFLGDRLIALCCRNTETVSLLDVITGHLCVQFCGPGSSGLAFIWDGTKLVSCSPIRIYDITNLVAKYQYEPACETWGMDGWWVRTMSYCFGSHLSTGDFYACLTQKWSWSGQQRWTSLTSSLA